MKTIPFLALFATLILTTSYVSAVITPEKSVSIAVNDFNHFRVHRQANDVALSWAVNAANVSSFTIERSWDGEFFDEAATFPAQGSGTHKYLDSPGGGGTFFYRITAVMEDGSSVQSDVQSVRLVKRK